MEPLFIDVTLSDREVDQLLIELKEAYHNQDPNMFDIANRIASNSKEHLDSNTYLWVMYVYKTYFSQQRIGVKYPYARMRQILDALDNKYKKPKALDMNGHSLSDTMVKDIYDGSAFMDESVKGIKKTYMLIQIFITLAFFAVLVWMLKVNIFISLGVSLIVFIFNYFVRFNKFKENYIKDQTFLLYQGCPDKILTEFDNPVIHS